MKKTATISKRQPMKKESAPRTDKSDGIIGEESISDFVEREYYDYGVVVNEDRAIPSAIDGLKPVQRRSLWGAYQLRALPGTSPTKAARVVGETMGRFHPHGDSSIYQAYVLMANSPMRLIVGEGNWGTISDEAAAQRYTNCTLSKYAVACFFDKFYQPIVKFVPNYDDKEVEPLELPALLPNLLLNGTSGIGVGTTSDIPSYSLGSLVKLLQKVITSGKPCQAKDCLSLEFTTPYGGIVNTGSQKAQLLDFYKTGSGSVVYEPVYEIDHKGREIMVRGFGLRGGFEKALATIQDMPEVQSANDIADPEDRLGLVSIILKKSVPVKDFEKVAKKVTAPFGSKASFKTNVTSRSVNEKGLSQASLRSSSIPDIIDSWLKNRISLEKEACAYWIKENDKQIEKYELLIKAVANIDLILSALKKKISDEELEKYIAKSLKITIEQARTILDLKVRQLRSLEGDVLKSKIKECKSEIASLNKRRTKPGDYIVTHLSELSKTLGG